LASSLFDSSQNPFADFVLKSKVKNRQAVFATRFREASAEQRVLNCLPAPLAGNSIFIKTTTHHTVNFGQNWPCKN